MNIIFTNMIKDFYKVLGVMSGTSLDGIDIALCEFQKQQQWSFKIIHSTTIPYNQDWKIKLQNLVNYNQDELKVIDENYTYYLADILNQYLEKNNIDELDFISSHGHTAIHEPDKGLTFQIGNLPVLAELTKHTVVCDFRTQDVNLGGQGAPLVPIGDQLLFSEYDYCVNLGGFANVSFQKDEVSIAYDICPVNIVLNHYVKHFNLEYDDSGNIASQGRLNQELLLELNQLEFYQKNSPKSLGIEWVIDTFYKVLNQFKISNEDILRTLVEHIAIQVAGVFKKTESKVLITGGGAYNTFLINKIKAHTNAMIVLPLPELIEFKEALIFAFLGVLKARGEHNCLKSVTGAKRDHSSGRIYLPK